MAYHPGPYRDPDTLPGANVVRPKLHSARKLRLTPTLGYVFDENGVVEGMDPIKQMVVLLVARAERDIDGDTGIIDDRSLTAQRRRIRQALSILVDGPEPVITDLEIVVAQDAPGVVMRTVSYRPLPGNKLQTVQLP